MTGPPPGHGVPLAEAVWTWARVAALSFGGPAGQIAVMHRIIVEEKRWLSEARFLHALNYCMLLPGPEAQQLATYIGWLMHRTKGGLIAGALFVLPGFVAIMALSWLYALYGNVGAVAALFFGLKAAVLAIVLDAVRRIGGRTLKNAALQALAATAFVAIFFFGLPFPVIVLTAGLIGWLASRAGARAFAAAGHGPASPGGEEEVVTLLGDEIPAHARAGLRSTLPVSTILLLLWLAPVVLLLALLGPDHVYSEIGLFFSQMAVVTFGGAYAVLAYVAQEAVGGFGWLQPGEMLDGLGMAETTPGPLIMVTQFVGFMGASRQAAGLDPMLAGTLGGMLTTWVTFVPCFLWIFLGAPFAERIRANRAVSAALTAISASIVGVILNLALWFALHSLFGATQAVAWGPVAFDLPVPGSLNLPALVLTAAACLAIFRFRVGALWTLLGCGLAGIAWAAARGAI
ncbi:MAG TPA: chromate efflux transporter [Allosphingosinicella sp.]|nr:chromate efflux transporter [Allosphingosinicella sp.]